MRSVLVALLFASGCSPTATALIVTVTSDLRVPDELAVVRVSAGSARNDFLLDAGVTLPLSFAVEPRDGNGGTITILAEGRDATRTTTVSARATVTFAADRRLGLPMFLGKRCALVACSASETCLDGACRPAAIDASALDDVEGGEEL